jgi:salicylate hydroxylase
VYEQVDAKTEIGAGIQISPNASRLLQRYGLTRDLETASVVPAAVESRRWDDGRVLACEELGEPVATTYGAPYYHIHRADLLNILSQQLAGDELHLGRRCVDIVDKGNVVVAKFEDGSAAEGDFLVGADGIHSRVGRYLFGDQRPSFSGNIAYRGLAPAERVAHLGLEVKSTNWMGPGGHFVHYFVSGGRYLNFVAVREQSDWVRESWTDHADISEVHASYQGWHPQIHAILDAVDEAFKWALFDREPLATWSKGRVTLLGDACHPMLPYMAQGAAQAIEDGATLAACIRGASAKTIEGAINLYETLRKPRTAQIQALARRNSSVFHLPDGPEQRERDARMAARRDQSKVSKGPSVRTMIFGHDSAQIGIGGQETASTPN